MKLIDALRINNLARTAKSGEFVVDMVCGFTPLHLATIFSAFLQQRIADKRVVLRTGQFGDITGSLGSISTEHSSSEGVALFLEWTDLDARLGWRASGGWSSKILPDILETAERTLSLVRDRIQALGRNGTTVCVCLPTLPIVPAAFTPGSELSRLDGMLRQMVSAEATTLSEQPLVHVVNPQRVDMRSPLANRGDVASELSKGFPYTHEHTVVLADLMASLLVPMPPKKGLITDLDDTLWRGIVGDAGAEGVGRSMVDGGQVHRLYQQLLDSLADAGTLLAVASKNDQDLAMKALDHPDQLISSSAFYPVVANWGPKSQSVAGILRAWNISSDSVVFVDDSPLELEEVKAKFPDIACHRFPKDDPRAAVELLELLRDVFGKRTIVDEDKLRQSSIRASAELHVNDSDDRTHTEALLSGLASEVELQFSTDPTDDRAFQLVNKTNQFNLNGLRFTEREWYALHVDEGYTRLTVSYRDKFGPLGKIAVLLCKKEGDDLLVNSWVMSCRAFARRIELLCLDRLFSHFGVDRIRFHFQATERNVPLQNMFTALLGEGWSTSAPQISELQLNAKIPPLYFNVTATSSTHST